MPRFHLTLFGSPRLEREEQLVPMRRRKAFSLLAYLATTGQTHQREAMLSLLWSQYDLDSARNSLRRELSNLRRMLDGQYLVVDWNHLRLEMDTDLVIDVQQFEALRRAGRIHDHSQRQLCPSCYQSLKTAVDLGAETFMSGFNLRDAPEFSRWITAQRRRLEGRLGESLQRLVEHHIVEHDYEPGIPLAQRWLALDPLHEPAHCVLMSLYAWSGQQSAALRQYEACETLLHEELNIAPSAQTVALYQTIVSRRGDAPLVVQEPLSLVVPPVFLDDEAPWRRARRAPFVERDAELGQLTEMWQRSLAGEPGMAFITGEAGQGKSALLAAFADKLQRQHQNVVVARGVCDIYTGVGDPYLPFRDILSMLSGDVDSHWRAGLIDREQALRLWHLLPQMARTILSVGEGLLDTLLAGQPLINRIHTYMAQGGSGGLGALPERIEEKRVRNRGQSPKQSQLFEQVTAVLATLAEQQPLLLLIDDLHWADISSLSLLTHLCRRLSRSPILIVAAYRPEEVGPEHGDQGVSWRRLLSEFKRQFGDIWIHLDETSPERAWAFVNALLDTEPNRLGASFRQALAEHTQGHPLFTVELLRHLQDQGQLVQDEGGYWIAGPELNLTVLPPRAEGVIEGRIQRLDDELKEMLRVASIAGEEFVAEVVASVVQVAPQTVIRRLSRELDRQHHLVRNEGNLSLNGQSLSLYRFRHNLFQQYVVEQLDPSERAYLHLQVGEALVSLHADDKEPVAVQLARHFREAGRLAQAAAFLELAGQTAVRTSASQEAIWLYREALDLVQQLAPLSEHVATELRLQLALGNAYIAFYGFATPELRAISIRVRALSRQVTAPMQQAAALWSVWLYSFHQAEHELAAETRDRLLSLAHVSQSEVIRLQSHHVNWTGAMAQGAFADAVQQMEAALALYEPARHHKDSLSFGGHDAAVCCQILGGLSVWFLGYPERALRLHESAIALAETLNHSFSLAQAYHYVALMWQLRGDPRQVEQTATRAIAYSDEVGLPYWSNWGRILLGWSVARRADADAGVAMMQESMAIWDDKPLDFHRPYFMALLAEGQRLQGQLELSLETVVEALALARTFERRWFEADLLRRQGGLTLALAGEAGVATVEHNYEEAIQVARGQEAKALELRVAVDLARLWQNQGRNREGREMLASVKSWFDEGRESVDWQAAHSLEAELTWAGTSGQDPVQGQRND